MLQSMHQRQGQSLSGLYPKKTMSKSVRSCVKSTQRANLLEVYEPISLGTNTDIPLGDKETSEPKSEPKEPAEPEKKKSDTPLEQPKSEQPKEPSQDSQASKESASEKKATPAQEQTQKPAPKQDSAAKPPPPSTAASTSSGREERRVYLCLR